MPTLTWLGHATFRFETPGGKIILIDPWVMNNPMCPEKEKAIGRLDAMLVTHAHGDHIGDAVEIGTKHGSGGSAPDVGCGFRPWY